MKRITTRDELITLANKLGVRPDWHEPDEQDVTATTHGASFENAGFWPIEKGMTSTIVEQHVILYKDGDPVAAVNLATLFAWATGYEVPRATAVLTEEEEEIIIRFRARGI